MKRIIVIGANGQVGTETCLYLREMGYDVIPIVRSLVGSILLKKLGFKCRIIKIVDNESCKSAISDSDLIVDFSVQSGSLIEIENTLKKQIRLILENCAATVPYIYTSSIMAYGMYDESSEFKNYLLSRTIYSKWKRIGEKTAIKLGKKYYKKVYVFRLGHVYGFLQSVQLNFLQELKNGKKKYILPDKISSTVFVCSIAEVIEKVIHSELKPLKYTLITYPFWTWEKLYNYIAEKNGYNIEIITQKPDDNTSFLKQDMQIISRICKDLILKYNETIRAYALKYFRDCELRLRATNLINNAGNEIDQYNSYYNQLDRQEFLGTPKGQFVNSMTNPREVMSKHEKNITDLFNSIVPNK